MNIYNLSSLIGFYTKHSEAKNALRNWYHDVASKEWKKPSDIMNDFNTAKTIKNNRAIFKINGNAYRLVVEVNYRKEWVFVKFIGTHAEYDNIDPETIDLFKPQKKG